MISAFAFMRLVSALGSGRLVNRIGERLVLAVGIGIVAVSSALAGLAQSYTQLLLLRGVGGIGSAMFTVSAISLLLRVVDADQRGRATGMWQSGFLIGAIAGPAIGGPLTDISLRAPFFVYAVTLAVAGGIGLVFLRQASLHDLGPGRPEGRDHGDAAAGPARLRLPRRPDGQPGQRLGAFGVRSSLIPLFVTEGIGASGTWIGIGFFVSAAAQGGLLLWAGGFADRVGRRPAMILGSAVATSSMAAVAVSDSLAVYTVAMALFGAGSAFLSVAPSAAVGDVVSRPRRHRDRRLPDVGRPGGRDRAAGGRLAGRRVLVRRRVRRHRRRAGGRPRRSPAVQGDPAPGRGRGTGTGSRHHRLRQPTQTAARVNVRCVTPLGERVASIS